MNDGRRYRLDDLRRFASALGSGAGLPRPRATALASHLLWFDAAGASTFGIATLPDWLGRLERGEVAPGAEGRVVGEHAATAVFDGQGGVPPLILARAASLAVEKARDVGMGIVRVTRLGPTGPAAALAAEVAIGPEIAWILGPGPSWTLALPTAEGLPAVFDSALAGGRAAAPPGDLAALVGPWTALTTEGGWLVLAAAVAAMESLATFHERIGATLKGREEGPGQLLPGPWAERREDARSRGVVVAPETMTALGRWAGRLGVEPPSPRAD